MTSNSKEPRRLQWKWVWITLGMFVVLYIIPLTAISLVRGELAAKIIGGWTFGGIVIVTALAGYLSKGVTIWEPALAGGLLTILWYIGLQVISANQGIAIKLDVFQLVVVLGAIFGLSLLGAGLGEGIQNATRKIKESIEETKQQ